MSLFPSPDSFSFTEIDDGDRVNEIPPPPSQEHEADISGSAWNNKLVEQCVRGILEQNGGEREREKKGKNSQTLLPSRGKGLSETRAIHPFRKTVRSILSHHPWKNFRDINSSRSIFISGMNVRNKAERQV